jgi:hypothetical protein
LTFRPIGEVVLPSNEFGLVGGFGSFFGVRRLDAALPLTALTISIAGTIANHTTGCVAPVCPACPDAGREQSEGRASRGTCLAFYLKFQISDLQLPLLVFARDFLHVTHASRSASPIERLRYNTAHEPPANLL